MPPANDNDRPSELSDTASSGPGSGAPLSEIFGLDPQRPQARVDPLLGIEIGGVRIVRFVAEGGMGRVYEGRQERPNRPVAVKVMRPGLATPSIIKRFEYEAEILARLRHPGIAQIYAAGVHTAAGAPVPYFIMEFIPSARPLTRYADDLKLTTRARLDLFCGVCDAVAHGHQRGVIHRDLKPNNILVDSSGQPKVIDFGVAKVTDSDVALTTMQTDVGQLIGTLQYMGPEQMAGDPNEIDIRCDVYALGVVLYELLTGRLPYDLRQKAVFEVMRIVREEEPTPISSLNRTLRRDVAVIAGKCLEKEPIRRYASATALGDDVRRYLAGEAITAKPQGLLEGVIRLARKHRVAAVATGAVFAVLSVAVLTISIFARNAEVARQHADSERLAADEASVAAEARRRQAETAEAAMRDFASQAVEARKQADTERVTAEKAREAAENQRRQAQTAEARMRDFARKADAAREHADAERLAADNARGSAEEGQRRAKTAEADAVRRLYEANLYRLDRLIKERNFGLARSIFAESTEPYHGKPLPIELACVNAQLDEALVIYEGCSAGVTAIAFSLDGARLTTASRDAWGDGSARDTTARLWDATTGKQLALLAGGEDPVSVFGLAVSSDGKHLATGSVGGKVRLWDACTGEQRFVLKGHTHLVETLAFNANGTILATGSTDGTARLWTVSTGKQVAVLNVNGSMLAFSPDGTKLATMTRSDALGRCQLELWDTRSGKQIAPLAGYHAYARAAVFSPDSTKLATAADDGNARVWDLDAGRLLAVLEGHAGPVVTLAFSPDGTRIATGSWDGTARLWDTNTHGQIAVLKGHEGPVFHLGYSEDGTKLATGSADRTARLWDAGTGKQLMVLGGHAAAITTLAFSPDGMRLATGSQDETARLWDITTIEPLAVLSSHGNGHRGLALTFSPDGTKLTTASDEGVARIWDTGTVQPLGVLEGHADTVFTLAYSPNGKTLATGSEDKTARLWDTRTGKLLAVLVGTSERGNTTRGTSSELSFAFSPDGEKLATGSQVWDTVTRKALAELSNMPVNTLAFSPDGTKLATAWFSTSQIWDAATGKQRVTLRGHTDEIVALAFSPDGTKLATGGHDGTARLWDPATGKPLRVLEGHTDAVVSVAFSPDGSRFATGSHDGTARLWDPDTGKQLTVLEGHADQVVTIAFSPDGTRIATGSWDRTVRLWDAKLGNQLAVLSGHAAIIVTLAFSPTGSTIATGDWDGTVRLWGLSNAAIYKARLHAAAVEKRLDAQVTKWLKDGPDAAVAKLRASQPKMAPDEVRIAGNMIFTRSSAIREERPPVPTIEDTDLFEAKDGPVVPSMEGPNPF